MRRQRPSVCGLLFVTTSMLGCNGSAKGAGGATSGSTAQGSSQSASSASGSSTSQSSSVSASSSTGGPLTKRRVFATSQTFPGTLGGVAQMEAACQAAATAAGLGGNWQAWIGTQNNVPATRFVHGTIPYVLVNGPEIAMDWSGLTSGTLESPIDRDETGAQITTPLPAVWTGVRADGTTVGGECGNWSVGTMNGWVGSAVDGSMNWSMYAGNTCATKNRLYCFEQ